MRLPQIRMESQMAKIQIQQTPGKQEIQQPNAKTSIQLPKAQVSMSTTPSKLQIDQTKAWEDMNLMHITKRNDKFAQEGVQAIKEGMARRAQQGSQLMKIENNGNPIASQAIANGYDGKKNLGIKFIPSHFSVKINYQPSEVHINVQTNKPVIEATIRKPEHIYKKGSVDISMQQYQELEIDFINLFG
ncbi:hypothetical protein CIL05_04725 [Virgibacillus profundi]|uniref:YviE n=1 Tax=Virgibacillus profundi TaxID=2024555 RepID=A0A2A2IHB2_9BACI|nr:DUF6470 family protein [Virgibacillus profundi]PAV31017.1 hypothetical protein CIL05_04725 [Virgibacillus profundi]PXY55202.1 hypothetical protein CIT14_04810 [Virgibacillus profundi]